MCVLVWMTSQQQSENTHGIKASLQGVLLGGCHGDLGHQAVARRLLSCCGLSQCFGASVTVARALLSGSYGKSYSHWHIASCYLSLRCWVQRFGFESRLGFSHGAFLIFEINTYCNMY